MTCKPSRLLKAVQTTGASLTELYESLRNASQNAEENLQLAHAIHRYIERYFTGDNQPLLKRSGEVLITELTMAGYLANDSIRLSLVDHITDLLRQGVTLRNRLKKNYSRAQIDPALMRPPYTWPSKKPCLAAKRLLSVLT